MAIREGNNLQAWCRNLVLASRPNGKAWEQMLSRTHREGQTQPVMVEALTACREAAEGFEQVLRDAECAEDTMAPQRALMAEVMQHDPGSGPRWQ
jgi:hypothetical protein